MWYAGGGPTGSAPTQTGPPTRHGRSHDLDVDGALEVCAGFLEVFCS